MSSHSRTSFLQWVRTRFHPLWRIRRSPRLHALLTRLDFPVWVHIPAIGMPVRVYWFRDMPWLFNSVPKEPSVERVVQELCETFRPRVFWDVGANLGWYSWLVTARSKLTRSLAFEPLPQNCSLLQATVTRNRLTHIVLKQTAVADRSGTMTFIVDTKSGATSQLSELFQSSGETAIAHAYGLNEEIQVECTTLDDVIISGESTPELIKVDVEEAEHLVFKGASQLLAAGKAIVVFECNRLSAMEELMRHHYRIFAIDDLQNYVAVPPALLEKAAPITAKLKPFQPA